VQALHFGSVVDHRAQCINSIQLLERLFHRIDGGADAETKPLLFPSTIFMP
jgi:hypothetical protein